MIWPLISAEAEGLGRVAAYDNHTAVPPTHERTSSPREHHRQRIKRGYQPAHSSKVRAGGQGASGAASQTHLANATGPGERDLAARRANVGSRARTGSQGPI